jgi:hypothetical protein
MSKLSPFDFINAITSTKEDILKKDPLAVREYKKSAFIVNRGLSYFIDTIVYANVVNMNHNIPPEWQFSFLINSISKKKRFSKWNEKEKLGKNLSLVKEYFKYSDEKAKVALSILTDEQLKEIEEKLYKGGRS